jgi:putative ABC transport system permease protein
MTKKDIGFDRENLIIIKRSDAFFEQRESFREQILQIPGVEKAGFSRSVPGRGFNNNAFLKEDDPEKNTYLINQSQVSYDFPEALGVKLAEGRFFSRDFGTDSAAILINEAAVKSLGMTDPIGKYLLQPAGPQQFTRLKIIGVMKDFNIASMHKPIDPVCFTVLGNVGGDQFTTIRLSGKDQQAAIRAIEQKWQSYTTRQPFQFDFFNDIWNDLYLAEMKTGKIFIVFSVLAVFIAILGLLGLVTFITNKRTKEIGIRKTYGASIETVLALLSREVVYLILISSAIAYPIALFGAKYWLKGFADKVNINPLVFILATTVALAAGWLSTFYQTLKAASYSPANALRND